MAVILLAATAPAQIARTLEGEDCAPWAKVEVLEDTKTRFSNEDYLDVTAHKVFATFGGGVVKAFGSKRPSPSSERVFPPGGHVIVAWRLSSSP